MLSIEKCKKILGKNFQEDEVNEITNVLYKFAEVYVEDYLRDYNKVNYKLNKKVKNSTS